MRLKRTTSIDKDFKTLTEKLDLELKNIYGSSQEEFDEYNFINNVNTVVVAYSTNKPVGCGCFKEYESNKAELKRMFVEPAYRGKGVGTSILSALENWAKETGMSSMILETGTLQPDAIELYKNKGYKIIPNFGQYAGNDLSVCMEKILFEDK
ncbi:MAG: GNAT family N-acetyltransferase [Sphingobacteriales bacterium]|nr:GNAT family N-acetyltransferase [Sphingobacteriales bacterium]